MKITPFESLNVRKMQTRTGKCYRVRLGNLHMIFEFDYKTDTVLILDLGYRGNIY
jgi:mRNA-degrading endonuclease RelE of RelBE toxin-antitoxin system